MKKNMSLIDFLTLLSECTADGAIDIITYFQLGGLSVENIDVYNVIETVEAAKAVKKKKKVVSARLFLLINAQQKLGIFIREKFMLKDTILQIIVVLCAVALIFVLLSTPFFSKKACADELIVHGVSSHSHPVEIGLKLNQVNPGLGYVYDIDSETGVRAGFYKNSYFRESVYAGIDNHTRPSGNFRFGAVFGVFSGYGSGYIIPMVLPYVDIRAGNYFAEVAVIPNPANVVLTFSLGVSL